MSTDNNKITRGVLDKLRSGESISDKELVIGIETLEPMVVFLREAGEMFYLSWRYLDEKLYQLKCFREARKTK